ncbi:MAG: hypothetical protein R8K50_04715 [Mariprofundus sp.]
MAKTDHSYSNPRLWYEAAMMRIPVLAQAEAAQRQIMADAHNANNNITDAEALADQKLYIQGYMELEEYERYLFFKHSRPTG